MQSNLRKRNDFESPVFNIEEPQSRRAAVVSFPGIDEKFGSVSKRQQLRVLLIYTTMCVVAFAVFNLVEIVEFRAFALGMLAPGAGLLLWAGPENPSQILAILSALGVSGAFAASIVVWIGTGNAMLPPAVWITGAFIGAASNGLLADNNPDYVWDLLPLYFSLALFASIGAGFVGNLYTRKMRIAKRDALDDAIKSIDLRPAMPCKPKLSELSIEDLQRMRLLLDRALQPIDSFEGFEWIDQFQTSAVRYQLNFMSYGLSMAQSNYLPAFGGYLNTAQQNLATKLQNHRVWRYWQLENLWGNLRTGKDPMPQDNIMYSGFMAAQLAYFQNASGLKTFGAPRSITCAHPHGEKFSYSLPDITKLLASQYHNAKYGLVACEPNWIYPLCNFITASGIRAYDTAAGTSNWDKIERRFREYLEQEFVRADGQLVPFRSSYTGIAMPQVGGAVMQAFPCMFLNTVLPDLAQRQWAIFQKRLNGRDLKKMCWPIDVGNYGFSRAASYAATATAAMEMGDSEFAKELLQHLDDECSLHVINGVAHRDNASLWTHSVEFIARCSSEGSLKNLVTAPSKDMMASPYVKKAEYPNVLIARAVYDDGKLSVVVHPGRSSGYQAITIGGLNPHESYILLTESTQQFKANILGAAKLNIWINGRTEFSVVLSEATPS